MIMATITLKKTALLVILSLLVVAYGALVGAQTFGTGWIVAYWNNTIPVGAPHYSEFLPNGLNFNWATNSPAPGINPDNWSARFASVQQFNQGTYEFVVTSDDGVRVIIDGIFVLDRFSPRNMTVTDRFQHTFSAGVHSLQVEFVDFVGPAVLQFQWFQVGILPTPITPTVTQETTVAPTPIAPTVTQETPIAPTPTLPFATSTQAAPPPLDSRVNARHLGAPVAIYCFNSGVHVYAINRQGQGALAFVSTRREILSALISEQEGNVLVETGQGANGEISLWILETGEFQVLPPDEGKYYDFIWDGCGL
jgi:hypothetical protein